MGHLGVLMEKGLATCAFTWVFTCAAWGCRHNARAWAPRRTLRELESVAGAPFDGALISARKPREPSPTSTWWLLGKGTGALLNPPGSRSRPYLSRRTLAPTRYADLLGHTPGSFKGFGMDHARVFKLPAVQKPSCALCATRRFLGTLAECAGALPYDSLGRWRASPPRATERM